MPELSVSKKNVMELLTLKDFRSTKKHYIIPEYQRPYNWDLDNCSTLWSDLTNFYSEHPQDNKEYFLGSIVTCFTDSDGIDIIDGQQRITSLLLLLRAFYLVLEETKQEFPDDREVRKLMEKIEPCIWNTYGISEEVKDKKDIHIQSKVLLDEDNQEFNDILECGEAYSKPSSNYGINYNYFLKKVREYHKMQWKDLCYFILNRCIVLPIECTDLDSALTIFGTLNNRGLPLSDSDIFKSQLFKQQTTEEDKSIFIEKWQNLGSILKQSNFSYDDIFRFYMHVIRAKNNDVSKEISLRRFYAGVDNKFEKLKEGNIIDNLIDLATFWVTISTLEECEFANKEGVKWLHTLDNFANDIWRYPLSVFFFKYKNSKDFKELFSVFLKKLLSHLLVKFIDTKAVNNLKQDVFNFCVSIYTNGSIRSSTKIIPIDFENKFIGCSQSRITKAMLLLNAYLSDTTQDCNFAIKHSQIEHILPKNWNKSYYNPFNNTDIQVSEEGVMMYIEQFGNKILFEKKLNIRAGDKYFEKKKQDYAKSKIKETFKFSESNKTDWKIDDIIKRTASIFNTLTDFFKQNLDNNEDK